MPYKLRLNLPNVPKGQEVAINGLGAFKNGAEHTISDEQHETFRVLNQTQDYDMDVEPNEIGQRPVVSTLGPSLTEAFKNNEFVTVTKVAEKSEGSDK